MKYPALIKKLKIKNFKFQISKHPFLGRFYPKKSIYRRALAVLLAFLVLVPSVFIIFRPSQASADWFDDSYANRQSFSFTHNADISTERAITFSLDTATLISAGVMQADCDDTRFTDINGKVLRYQLTGTCNNAATTYEVIFPSIISGTNVGIVYYGNPQALSHSENVSSVTALTPSGGDPSITTRTAEEKAPAPALSLKFDEGYGQTAYDTSSNKNNGTLTNGPAWQTEDMCISGKCLKLDGVDDYVRVDANLNLTSAATINAWIRTPGTGGWQAVVDYGSNPYTGSIYINSAGAPRCQFDSTTLAVTAVSDATSNLNNNTWHLITCTYDGSNINIYIDGNYKNQVAYSGTLDNTLQRLTLGTEAGSLAQYPFAGFIDDVKIYPYARTASQIKTDAASRIPSVHGISASFGDDQSYLSNGLVGYWKMDDGVNNPCASGVDKACDSSGNNNVGTWTGNVASISGKFGNATTYDGTGDYVSIPDSSTVDITGSGSFSSWIYPTTLSASSSILGKRDASATEANYAIRTSSTASDELDFYFSISGAWQTYTTTNADLAVNNWYLITVTYDQNTVRIYKNGQLLSGSCTIGICTGALQPDNNTLGMGRPGDLVGQYFTGKIDDVRIYNRALSPSEITRLYDWAPGPVGWWKMDENTGNSANDSSGNGNTGTLTNGPTWTPGKFGSALKFNGVDDYVQLAASTETILHDPNPNSYSYSIWFKTTTTTGYAQPISDYNYNGTDLNYGMNLYFFNGALRASVRSSGNTYNTTPDVSGYNDNTWHFATVTVDKSALTQNLYVDGVLKSTVAIGNYDYIDPTPLLAGGAYNGSYVSFFPGTIDDVRIYNYVRTQKQIIQDMNGGHPAVGSPVGSAVAQWNFDEGFGTTAHSSGSCATCSGALVNMASPATYGSGWTTSGKFGKALNFDGINDYVQASNSSILNITGSITLSAWVKKQELSRIESIVSKSPYSLKIGADAKPYMELIAGDETIADVGQLGSNTYVYSLTVYDGKLYGGTYNSGKVYRYENGAWTNTGQLGSTTTVYSLAVYNGKLYGGTQAGHVYRYDGDTAWTDLGQLESNTNVYSLAVYDGKLYAGISYGASAYVYSYNGSTWTSTGKVGGINATSVNSLAVYDGKLYAGISDSSNTAAVYRYDGGTTWTSVGNGSATQNIYTLAVYDGKLYNSGSTYNNIYRYDGGTTWTSVGGTSSNVLSLAVYDGKLYAGTGTTTGKIYRYDGDTAWTDLGQLGSETRVYSLAVYDGKLYAGTYSSGKVYSIGTGLSVYSGTAIGNDFSHISAAYDGATARIFINGVEKGTRTASVTIGGSSDHLLIGASKGTSQGGYSSSGEDYFSGTLDSVSIYNYALNAQEIKVDYNRGKGVVMGALSANPNGSATNSASRAYCPPGNSEGNCAAGSDPSPVAHWALDENTGATANDISGNANTGTLTNGPAWTPGKIGSALKFDGVDDYVNTTSTTAFNFERTQPFSIGSWIKSNYNGSSYMVFVSNMHATNNSGYEFMIDGTLAGKPLGFAILNSGPTEYLYVKDSTNFNLLDNQWHYVLATYDGSSSINGIKLYIDGISKITAKVSGSDSLTTSVLTNSSLKIGKQGDTANAYNFNGSLDDVRIYNYARTPAQVAWDYNRGKPVGWWKFDECLDTTAHDASGNGNNGTITIGATGGNTSTGNCSTVDTATAWYNGRTGKFNSALSFDGVNDYVSMPSTTIPAAVTYAAWINLSDTANSTRQTVIGAAHSSSIPMDIMEIMPATSTDFRIGLYDYKSSGNYIEWRGSTSLPKNTWLHIVAVQSSPGSTPTFYLNGIPETVTLYGNAGTVDTRPTQILSIGRLGNYNGWYFKGLIDDARLYNYALTPQQIKLLYNGDSALRFGPSQGSP